MKKLSISDNDFLVAIRHNDFKKAVLAKNVKEEDFKRYQPVLNSKVQLFWNTNYRLCQSMSISKQDLKQYANCWLVNWVGLHETDRPEVENKKLFHVYLRQRFIRLKSIMDRKLRTSDLDASRYFDESDAPEFRPTSALTRGRKASFKTQKALSQMDPKVAERKLNRLIRHSKDPDVVLAAQKHLERIRQAIP